VFKECLLNTGGSSGKCSQPTESLQPAGVTLDCERQSDIWYPWIVNDTDNSVRCRVYIFTNTAL